MKQCHVDCLARLNKLINFYDDLIEFLLQQKIITSEQHKSFYLEREKDKHLCEILFTAVRDDFIQLLTFDWVLLPDERIQIKVITDRDTKEYVYKW